MQVWSFVQRNGLPDLGSLWRQMAKLRMTFRASHTRPVDETQAAFLLVAAICGIALRSRVRGFESCWERC
jgi:hypothetical protein